MAAAVSGGPHSLVLASYLLEPLRLVTTLAGPKNMLARLPRRVSLRHQCNVPFIPHNTQLLKQDKKLVCRRGLDEIRVRGRASFMKYVQT